MADKALRSRYKSTTGEDVCTKNDLSKLLAENRQWMEKQFDSISSQLEAVSKRVTIVETEQKEQARALLYYGDEIQDIKASLDIIMSEKEAMTQSSSSMAYLTKSVIKVEQERNLKTLLINGVPKTENENLLTFIEKLSEKLEVSFSAADIDSVFRAKPKTDSARPPVIIIKFNSLGARDALYDGRKSIIKNKVTTKSLGVNQVDSNVYINEQLTKLEADLFYKVREKKRELTYKYAWTFHGHIFMRKEKSSEAIRINSDKDLIDLH